jgi:hypothetical protein
MPRQTFLSRDSFVDATEKQTQENLYALPAYVDHIRLVEENKRIGSIRFMYDRIGKKISFYIDVTVLPLNDQYTRISLHASHLNGHAFFEDADLSCALHDFEAAIHASIKGDLSHYVPLGVKIQKKQEEFNVIAQARVFFTNMFFKKKLS